MFDNLGKKKLLKFNTQIRINGKEKSSNLAGYRILFSSRWKVLLCILYNNIFVFLKFLWNAKYLKIPSIRSVFNSTAYIFQHSLNSKFLWRKPNQDKFQNLRTSSDKGIQGIENKRQNSWDIRQRVSREMEKYMCLRVLKKYINAEKKDF